MNNIAEKVHFKIITNIIINNQQFQNNFNSIIKLYTRQHLVQIGLVVINLKVDSQRNTKNNCSKRHPSL